MRMWYWKDKGKYQVRPDGDRSLSISTSLYPLATRVPLYGREKMGNVPFMVQRKEGQRADGREKSSWRKYQKHRGESNRCIMEEVQVSWKLYLSWFSEERRSKLCWYHNHHCSLQLLCLSLYHSYPSSIPLPHSTMEWNLSLPRQRNHGMNVSVNRDTKHRVNETPNRQGDRYPFKDIHCQTFVLLLGREGKGRRKGRKEGKDLLLHSGIVRSSLVVYTLRMSLFCCPSLSLSLSPFLSPYDGVCRSRKQLITRTTCSLRR